MKRNPIYYWLWLFVGLTLSYALVSCDDDEEALPVITNIRVIAKDSTIASAGFAEEIAIQGSNLSSVREVWFNDVKAVLVPTYVTDNNILVRIPDEGPNNITNTITLVTKSGNRATADFETIIPPPLIAQLYNEFAKPGTENIVLGRYFFYVQKVLIGEKEVEIISQTPTAINFKMPASVGQDRVTVVASGGTSVSAFRLNETEGNMMNFDIPATTWGNDICYGDAPRISPENSEIEPVAGKYALIEGENLPASGYQADWVLSTCYFDFGLAPAPAADRTFRFEAYIREPWNSGMYIFEIALESGEKFRYEWKPWSAPGVPGSGIKTNGWMTFATSATAFRKFADGKYVSPDVYITDVSKIRDLNIQFSNGAEGAKKIPLYFVALDNFRMVNAKAPN